MLIFWYKNKKIKKLYWINNQVIMCLLHLHPFINLDCLPRRIMRNILQWFNILEKLSARRWRMLGNRSFSLGAICSGWIEGMLIRGRLLMRLSGGIWRGTWIIAVSRIVKQRLKLLTTILEFLFIRSETLNNMKSWLMIISLK